MLIHPTVILAKLFQALSMCRLPFGALYMSQQVQLSQGCEEGTHFIAGELLYPLYCWGN